MMMNTADPTARSYSAVARRHVHDLPTDQNIWLFANRN